MAKTSPFKTPKETLHQSSVSKHFLWSSYLPSAPVFVFQCRLRIFKETCRFFSIPVLSVLFITTDDGECTMMVLVNRLAPHMPLCLYGTLINHVRHVIVHLHLFLVVFQRRLKRLTVFLRPQLLTSPVTFS